jgi:hypothetical protein
MTEISTEKLAVVGDVIQPGEDIPDNVQRFRTADDEIAYRDVNGIQLPWRLVSCENPGSCCTHSAEEFEWPLTVTAVRQQPAALDAPEPIRGGHFGLYEDPRRGKFGPGDMRLVEAEPAASEPVDLLDLGRQYGDARWREGTELDGGGDAWREARADADVLFNRIAEALAQQPVQARNHAREPLWIHGCGTVLADLRVPDTRRHACVIDEPGPWRPLLVATDPAPPAATDDQHRVLAYLDRQNERMTDELIKTRDERDEARAEGENWKRRFEEQAARGDEDAQRILTLPKVPEGAVALVTNGSGDGTLRWRRGVDDTWVRDDQPYDDEGHTLYELLTYGDSVRVEMAPPREPRTWPKLDSAPDDLRLFKGASGRQYRRHALPSLDRWYHDADEEGHEDWRPLAYWQQIDGPLTEVFDDEPGGQR